MLDGIRSSTRKAGIDGGKILLHNVTTTGLSHTLGVSFSAAVSIAACLMALEVQHNSQ
jgi:hypothetical protein